MTTRSTTADRLFYPIKKAVNAALTMDKMFGAKEIGYSDICTALAAEFATENLVLVSREDVRLALETAYRGDYAELDRPLDDASRREIDKIAASVFTELERSA